MLSVSARLFVIWLVCVVVGTLAPFDFSLVGDGHLFEHRMFTFGPEDRDPTHFVLNLLLFMPLGALLYREGRRRSLMPTSIALLVGTSACAISAGLEFCQAFEPPRDSSLLDLLANTGGGFLGAVASHMLGASSESTVNWLREHTSTTVLSVLIAGVLVVALLISAALQARTRLSNWSPDYPLLIGNEGTGDRPWRGRVLTLTMTDGATPLLWVRRFANSGSLITVGTPIVAFDFKGPPPFKDATGNVPNVEPTAPLDTRDEAASLLTDNWLASDGPAAHLTRRLEQTNAFTLRVQCASEDPEQEGPARIVSNSVNPLLRNFTLGQQGHDLVFRLRTPGTGDNGFPLELVVPAVFTDYGPRDILVTYDGATVLATIAHSNRVSRADLTPGSVAALAIPTLSVRADQLEAYELLYVAILSILPGWLVGFFGRAKRDRNVLGAIWVVAFAILFETTLVRASGRAFDWSNIVVTAAVSAVVFFLFNLPPSKSGVSPQPSLARS